MQDLIFSPLLQPGDTVYALAPSGPLTEYTAFDAGVHIWRDRGYNVVISPHIKEQHGYLAGMDEQRREDLRQAWLNPEYKAILSARGGYGGARILEGSILENWTWPKIDTPKWLIGFSDVTSLLWSLACNGIAGLHAPVLTTLAKDKESIDRLFTYLETGQLAPLQGSPWRNNQTKVATGKLLPFNLTTASHLLKTKYQPDFTGCILAFEDVTEAPYRLDRQLTHWRLLGLFENIAGIAIGSFTDCEPDTKHGKKPSFDVPTMLRDRLGDLPVPIVDGFGFGHGQKNAALPVGANVQLNGETGQLMFVAPTLSV